VFGQNGGPGKREPGKEEKGSLKAYPLFAIAPKLMEAQAGGHSLGTSTIQQWENMREWGTQGGKRYYRKEEESTTVEPSSLLSP